MLAPHCDRFGKMARPLNRDTDNTAFYARQQSGSLVCRQIAGFLSINCNNPIPFKNSALLSWTSWNDMDYHTQADKVAFNL